MRRKLAPCVYGAKKRRKQVTAFWLRDCWKWQGRLRSRRGPKGPPLRNWAERSSPGYADVLGCNGGTGAWTTHAGREQGKRARKRGRRQAAATDPCHCCGQLGHWKRECPNRRPAGIAGTAVGGEHFAGVCSAYSCTGDPLDAAEKPAAERFCSLAEEQAGAPVCVDIWATHHMVPTAAWLTDLTPSCPGMPSSVQLGNGRWTPVRGTGKLQLDSTVDGKHMVVELTNVLLVPQLQRGLVSVAALESRGAAVLLENGRCTVRINGEDVLQAERHKGGYRGQYGLVDARVQEHGVHHRQGL